MTGFKKATKASAKLRMALAGPAGAGKTYTALSLACALGQPVAVLDTERGSASKYADLFAFDVLELQSFNPERYVEAIHEAEQAGYAVLVIDSLSHAWMGKDGALELVDRAAKRSQSSNSYVAWREVTPAHNAMVDAIIGANLHVIVTMRSKQEYVQEKDDRGRTVIRKVGLAPVQRDGLEYEFDVYGDLDQDNTLMIGKTRCSTLAGAVIRKPGQPLAATLAEWLTGAPAQVDTVTSADDRRWKRWLEVKGAAEHLGVVLPEIRLPLPAHVLIGHGKTAVDLTAAREKELARQDLHRIEGKGATEYDRTIGAADWGEGPSQRGAANTAVEDEAAGCKTAASVPMVESKAHPAWKAWLEAERQARVANVPNDLEVTLPVELESLQAATDMLLELVAERRAA